MTIRGALPLTRARTASLSDRQEIDRSFTAALGADHESEAVVGAIIKLARALNLSVVAEGVETVEQRARLIAAGCPDVQGFLFSKPVSAADMDRLLAAAPA
jgi:EAL domain-containing protein (putative c-di-GMP-specific phosphodiesterase class I)